jgi:hypothetical protein
MLAGERVSLRREIDVPGCFGRNSGPVIGGEHPAEQAHDLVSIVRGAVQGGGSACWNFAW